MKYTYSVLDERPRGALALGYLDVVRAVGTKNISAVQDADNICIFPA